MDAFRAFPTFNLLAHPIRLPIRKKLDQFSDVSRIQWPTDMSAFIAQWLERRPSFPAVVRSSLGETDV